jgi:hypothetical protein
VGNYKANQISFHPFLNDTVLMAISGYGLKVRLGRIENGSILNEYGFNSNSPEFNCFGV